MHQTTVVPRPMDTDSKEGVDSSDDNEDEDEDEDFKDQGSSDDEDDILRNQIKDATAEDEDEDEDELEVIELESVPRNWKFPSTNRPTKQDESGRPIPNTTGLWRSRTQVRDQLQ